MFLHWDSSQPAFCWPLTDVPCLCVGYSRLPTLEVFLHAHPGAVPIIEPPDQTVGL